jgi:hypothetical protein
LALPPDPLKNLPPKLFYLRFRQFFLLKKIEIAPDFSTLYTTIPHSKLKDKLRELVQLCFIKKKGQRRYKYLVLGRDRSYFVKKKHHSDSTKKFSEKIKFYLLGIAARPTEKLAAQIILFAFQTIFFY